MADYFDAPSDPATDADIESAPIRSVWASLAAAFAKLAGYTGNGDKLVAINTGGTAQTTLTAAQARTLLGLVIGTNVQAYDADLTTWAGITPGTGVATALAVNVGTAGAPVVNGGALGTPSSGTLTNATGLPAAGVVGTAAILGANTFTGAQNFARATVASHATTADIWGATGNQIDWTGTATTTAFPNAPQAGAWRELICAGACSFTAGANMLIDGVSSGNTVTCAANDKIMVRAISTTQFNLTRTKYDGTAQVSSAGLSAASQAQAEAGTADTVAITPLSTKWHPGVAKVWLKGYNNGTTAVSHNVTSVTDDGVGLITVTIATDFSSGDYVVVTGLTRDLAAGEGYLVGVAATGAVAGSFQGWCIKRSDGSAVDPTEWFFACYGDQA